MKTYIAWFDFNSPDIYVNLQDSLMDGKTKHLYSIKMGSHNNLADWFAVRQYKNQNEDQNIIPFNKKPNPGFVSPVTES